MRTDEGAAMHIQGRINADELGTRITRARMAKNWSQTDLALGLKSRGVTAVFVSRLERGMIAFRDAAGLAKAKAVADYLKVEIPFQTEADRAPPASKAVALIAAPTKEPEPVEPKKPDVEVAVLASAAHALSKVEDPAARRRILGYLMERFVDDEGVKR